MHGNKNFESHQNTTNKNVLKVAKILTRAQRVNIISIGNKPTMPRVIDHFTLFDKKKAKNITKKKQLSIQSDNDNTDKAAINGDVTWWPLWELLSWYPII